MSCLRLSHVVYGVYGLRLRLLLVEVVVWLCFVVCFATCVFWCVNSVGVSFAFI